MGDVKIKLSALWAAVMLTYLLGDVLRLYAGDVRPGEIGGRPIPPEIYLGIAALMVIPIVMVVLSVTLNQPVNHWVNIVVAIIFLLFNLVGLPTYPGAYDKFLLVVSLVLNAWTVWYAWKWDLTRKDSSHASDCLHTIRDLPQKWCSAIRHNKINRC